MSCYNAERWLAEAVESVLQQTFSDFEFIAVDDGSRDSTARLLSEYAAADRRLIIVKKENSGLADSLNKGIALAKGKWIARIDADDICEPSRLRRQLKHASRDDSLTVIGSGFIEIDQNGQPLASHSYPTYHRALAKRLVRGRGFFPHSSAFFQRDAVAKIGGYRPQIRRAEDWDLWLRLSEVGKIGCNPEPLVRVRKHPNQISHVEQGKRQFVDAIAAVTAHYLRIQGKPDPLDGKPAEVAKYIGFIERSIDREGEWERRLAWQRFRKSYLETSKTAAARSLLLSGQGWSLLLGKYFGSSMPQRLAKHWTVLT
jgi:glycosyltransferase involved in cell wall biosynthesis